MAEKKKAVFPGSFDPFTLGHKSIVDRGLTLFDEIVIAIGVNEHKRSFMPVEKRLDYIRNIYADDPRVNVTVYQGLTIDFAKSIGSDILLRGVRNITDFEFEKNLADLNLHLGHLETVFLVSLPQYSAVSSTIVRELIHNGYDPSQLLPAKLNL